MLAQFNFQWTWMFILFTGLAYRSNAQHKTSDDVCKVSIYIDAIKTGIPYLDKSSDTMTIKEGETYYLRMLLISCKGKMYFERHRVSNGSMVFSGRYTDAVKLDTVHGWAVNPVTGKRHRDTSTWYQPIRTGIWKYYNKEGMLLKEEEYVNGKLIRSGKTVGTRPNNSLKR
ncbi:hypothetical protein FHW36_103505 [Chitinophaga polysaccharea]|uniref:MORN repeat protein n=1 Tax=Chitinophaga polysaccharea TaxID=1293035 RepID=A0A561PUB3_9BACT|nr:hypothetical protein [Chitinophaga polysaccharea]TWF41701.1 hypothetical protein FHW36_103505 [Chitinophaga polysaccharea]